MKKGVKKEIVRPGPTEQQTVASVKLFNERAAGELGLGLTGTDEASFAPLVILKICSGFASTIGFFSPYLPQLIILPSN